MKKALLLFSVCALLIVVFTNAVWAQKFAFVVVADPRPRNNYSGVEQDLRQIKYWIDNPTPDMPAPQFMEITGDFDHTGQMETIIDDTLGASFVWFPTIGNHEFDAMYDFYSVRDTLVPSLPWVVDYGPTGSINTTYSWDYGNAHFIAVNCYWDGTTNPGADYATDGDIPEELRDWIEADLIAHGKTHNFVFFHEPAYPEVRHVGDSIDKYSANRDSFVVMMDRNNVETFFVGHDHYYHHDVSSEHPLLGEVHQVDSGQIQGPGSGGDGSTIIYVLVDGDTTTYKAYRSTTGMPFSLHEEWYIASDGDYTLDVNVLGGGSVALNPSGGVYPESTSVELTATADSGWTFNGWSGDLTGSTNPDTLLMDGHKSVTATFVGSTAVCEDFESGYTLGQELRTHADWFYEDGNSGPIPTTGIGVDSSIGLSNGDRAFTWVPHGFKWSDPLLVGVYFQMDYQTDATGTFDDDRLGWTISDTDDYSDWIFGVQMDPGGTGPGGNIETYWDGDAFGDNGGRYSIVDLPALTGNTWYRLRGEFTKLTATSARVDVVLWELDAGGDTVGVVASGFVADTDLLPDTAGEEIPNPAYFTATSMWPVYKNFDAVDGAVDNPCFGIIASEAEQYTLSMTIVGNANVTLNPPGGIYAESTDVELTAVPESAWVFSGWSGDLTGNANPDTILMDGNKSVTATFVEEASGAVICENFESGFTLGQTVGNHSEWFDNGSGPVVNSGLGVASSVGLAQATAIFIWTAHSFDWTAAGFQGYHVQMDLQTDGSGHLDDDRVGWMIVNDNVSSSNIFGVQCDPGGDGPSGYNIEGYWDGASADRRPSIVNLPTLSANSWYRLRAEITKLTATSASIYAALIELDGSGDSVSVVASGSIPNTAALGADAPNSKYFTGPIWPAYKNYTAAGANADNTCFQVLTSGPVEQDTLTVNVVGNGSVTLNPPGGVYTTGTKVGLTANPDSGWAFSEWSGDLTGSTNPDTITMNSNKTVTATFTEIPVEGNWTQQSPDPHPPERAYHSLAYVGDDQVVLFGGRDGSYTNYNETWAYDFSANTWTQKNPSTKPSARRAHAMAYLGGDQVLMFGGWDGSVRNDETWVYDLSDNAWTQMNPSTSPSARLDIDMAYIAAGQVLMFGGDDGANDDETWVYDSSDTSWTQISPATNPSARHSYAMAHIGGDQVLMFGGDNGSLFDETWVYDLSGNAWTQMSPSTSPSARSGHAMVYLGGDQVLLFGGHDGSADDESWVYDLSDDDWVEDVGTPHPSARYGHRLSEASMAGSSQAVLFGGNTGSINDETWTFGMAQYTLTVNTVGNGSVVLDPPGGVYNFDTDVELTATADSGWIFSTWSGDLTGSANPDTITMTGDMTVTATFLEISSGVFCEDFESGFTLGVDVGEHADWFDGADAEGSDVTAGIGLLSSIGLGTGNRIFTWTAHPFDWNAPDFQKVSLQMDFQTDGSGNFDDDRVGWMITNTDYSSTNIFGAQLDHIDGGIVTYWRDNTGTRIQTQIVDISGLPANTWFRFRAEISRLAATEARIDVSLVELDGSGNPTGTPYTGTVANTSTWPGGAPDTKYFTASTIWPAYKNYQAIVGAADNACADIVIFAGPWDTLTVNTVGNGSVTLDPPGNVYPESTAVELTAVPDSGWEFSAWSGDLTGSANPDTITMAGNKAVTATFIELPPCTLMVNTVGNGSVTLNPPDSIYICGTDVVLTAVSDSGWAFSAWSGDLTGSANPDTITMAGNMSVTATFVEGPECTLTVSTVGNGSVTLNPPGGIYDYDTKVELTAVPDSGWVLSAWSGDLTGSANPDTIIMAGNKTVTATFEEEPSGTVVCEDFESGYTLGAELRTHPDWFYEAANSGPMPTAGIGVDGSIGLSNGDRAFAWVAHEFNWNDPLLVGVWFQMDYQTSATGVFDDDRLGWTISDTDDYSDWIFGVQMDPGGGGAGGNIETYWDGDAFGDNGGRYSIVDLPALSGNTWYRLLGEFTKLTATSARVDVTLWQLDASGDTVGQVVSGTVANTDSLPGGAGEELPNPAYFTATSMWPVYKNYNNTAGAVDNTCFGIITSGPVQQDTLTVNVVGNGSVSLDPPGNVYNTGSDVELTAVSDSGWVFSAWSGDLTGSANPDTITMAGNMSVTATFVEGLECTLTVNTVGSGSVTLNPPGGVYGWDAEVELTANADSGWVFSAWSGDLTGSANPDTITMAGSMTVTATFVEEPSGEEEQEDFESGFTLGQTVGTHIEWFDAGNGPVVNSGLGVASSVGLAPGTAIFIWTEHPFDWTAVNFLGYSVQMAFQTDGSGHLDDDRVGWMIVNDNVSSSNILGVQCDPGGDGPSGYNIEGYWDGASADRRPSIVNLPTLSANSWYCLRAEITKLTATSASIYAALIELDGSGDSVSVVASGSIANTATLGADAPHSKYFTGPIWPAYKNYTAAGANADEAWFQVLTSGPVQQDTLTVNVVGNGSVNLDPPGNIYNTGTDVELTAVSDSGWVFSAWSGDLTGSANPDTITMAGNMTVMATFVEGPECTLTVNTVGSGSVTLNPPGGVYDWDAKVELTAVPDSGWVFSAWSGDLTGSANPDTITMAGDKTVTATFVEEGELAAGDVIISSMQAWNSVGSQNPAEFVELFNTTNQTISLENMELISRTDNNSNGVMDIDWQLSATLTGKSIAPHSFFLIAESGVAADSNVHDVETAMDLATGEGGVAERAISLELVIDGVHMDYVLYGRDDGQNPVGEMPPGDIPFDSTASWPRSEVCRNTRGLDSFQEGLLRRETADDLYAGYAINGYYTDEGSLGQGYPNGVWYCPHDNTDDSYQARSSASDSVPSPYNNPPNQPTLVSPLDDAIDVALNPELRVNVTDPDSDTMSVTFYGQEVSASQNFTLIPIPDTQKYSESYPWIYYDQMQWIVDSMAVWNIVFAAHEGDIVDNAGVVLEWMRADTAMMILEDPVGTGLPEGIPYSITPGNHDTPTTNYNTYFGISRFSGRSYYGGHDGSDNDNNYTFFSAGGMDFIVVSLEVSPSSSIIAWADSLLGAHSSRRAIVVSHYILNTNGSWGGQGQLIYDTLKDNPNLFLMLCGHMHGEALRTEVFNGDTVHVVLADYQDISPGGNGWLRIMEFQPANNRIRVLTYSPYIDQYGTGIVMGDDTMSEEFFLSYDMSGRSAFTNLGTVDDVASGGDAFVNWPGRSPETEYEWYVQAIDGMDTTTSSVWSFTTIAAAPPEAVENLEIYTAFGTVDSTDVRLVWSPVTTDTAGSPLSIDSYVVYRNSDPGFTPGPAKELATTTDTTYVDANAAGNTGVHYFYYVNARSGGQESDNSLCVGEFDRDLDTSVKSK